MTVSALVLDSGDVRCGRCRRYGIDASESTGAVGFLMDSRVPVNHSFGFPVREGTADTGAYADGVSGGSKDGDSVTRG